MDDQSHRAEQLELLNRLDDSELVVLNERWAGRTSSEIAGALGISQTAARYHLGNIYDKLEVTYVEGGTSLARIMDFYTVIDDPNAPTIPRPDSLYQDELASPSQPSGQSLELVQDDDDALIAQRPVRAAGATDEPPPTRPIWIWVALGVAGILILALLLILLLGDEDDGDDEEEARSETATAFTMELNTTATALAGLATLDRQDLDATATQLSVLATQTQEGADVAGTEAANATASAQPTITPTPTEEPTATPEPTETPEPT